MKKEQPILSLCIPTYKRAEILSENLSIISEQLREVDLNELELIVSNNCSPDNTDEVVHSFIKLGMPITYNCNTENLGADGNFLKCMHISKGKYVWLLADDDYLEEGALSYILSCLRNKEYGLLYVECHRNINYEFKEYDDINKFFQQIGNEITFSSGCIFRRDIVETINHDMYLGSSFLQMPYFIASASSQSINAIVGRPIIKVGINASAPYDFYQVFVENYLLIINECFNKNPEINHKTKRYAKRAMAGFLFDHIYFDLIKPNNYTHIDKKKSRKLVWKYFGKEPYLYWGIFSSFLKNIRRFVKNQIKKIRK